MSAVPPPPPPPFSAATVTDAFQIVLQKGITGGFAPPTPDARTVLVRTPNSDTLTITAQTRAHATPSLGAAVTRDVDISEHAPALARLQTILRAVPTQYPGAMDLYGRNTSIVQVAEMDSGELHRTGMAAGVGVQEPTEEQRGLFDEAVSIIERLAA